MKSHLLSSAAPICLGVLFFQSSALAGQAPVIVNPMAVPEQVVITASPLFQNAIDQSASVAQVARQELLSSGGFGLGDALKDVPGVTSSGFTAGAARPIIRGLGATRVRVTENGLGSHDVSDVSDDHAVPIDPLASLKVEVLRGPATLRYGSQAIGGVVNAINNRIPMDVGEGAAVEGIGSIANNSTERLAAGLFDYREGNWAFHADGIVRGADDYETPHFTQDNSFAFGRGFALGGAYIGNGGAGGLGYNRYLAHYGIPTEPGASEVSHIELDQKNYTGALRFNMPVPGISLVNAQGGYSDYKHDEVLDGVGVASTFKNKEWEGRVEAIHQAFGPVTMGAIGLQYDNRDFEALGAGADYLLPTKTDSLGLYVFEEFALTGQFSIQAAARSEWTNVEGATVALGSFDRHFNPLSLALGAVYKPAMDTSLFVNLTRTARAPSVTELFAQGPHEATATFELGDPNSSEEKATSIEGGIRHETVDGDRASFSVFQNKFDGFITGLLTGNSYDEDGNFFPGDSEEFAELLYVQQDATFWGLEAQTHWHVLDIGNARAGLDLQADYVRATFDAGGNVPRIPPVRYGGGFFIESNLMELRLRVLHAEEPDKIAAHETPTPGFTTLDASAIFHLYRGPEGDLDLALFGANLTDSVQRNHVSFTKDHVVQPGRTFRLMLHYMR